MKKYALIVLGLSFLSLSTLATAADENVNSPQPSEEAVVNPVTATTPAPAEATQTETVSAEADATAQVTDAAPMDPAATASPAPAEVSNVATENLEFISGEVSSIDATAKTVTVKLYGETENNANDKILTVNVDEATDITDGEKDRDLASLAAGTEVDVEYDPASNKATYIFVY
jgi:hypothetical protein